MAGFRYKAFISYSHQDEQWASWLQRALEKYRIPKVMVGKRTGYGEIPAKSHGDFPLSEFFSHVI